jgi:hypothetical protein
MASFISRTALRRGSVVAQVEQTELGKMYSVNKTNAAQTPLHVISRLEKVFEESEDPLLRMSRGANTGVKWRIVRMQGGQGGRVAGALCPFNDLNVLEQIGGGSNTVALQQLPLFLNGHQVKFDPAIDAIHVATDQSIKAMFASSTEASSAYRVWELPQQQATTGPPERQWQPSNTKFSGETTNMQNYQAWEHVPTRSSRPPQVASVSNAPFSGNTTNMDNYKEWDLPERQNASPARKWQPSNTKFDGRTTNNSAYKAYIAAAQNSDPIRVIVDERTIA